MNSRSALPMKTRDLQNHHMDSTRWNDFKFRGDDVVIASYPKSGTTWLQQIVGQLIFNGSETLKINQVSPWLELRVLPLDAYVALQEQTHRRIIKTHLPLDALNFSATAKYIYIGRDGRDVAWSLHHHHVMANQLYYDLANDTPGLVGPKFERPDSDVRRYFLRWLAEDGVPFWSYWGNISTWWTARAAPNILFVNFSDLKNDLEGQIRRIADFLEIGVVERHWPQIIKHCTFEFAKENASDIVPLRGEVFMGGPQTFFNKGINGRWRSVLTAEDNADYERASLEHLGPDCAAWLVGI